MPSLKSILDKVDRQIVADVQKVHVGAQVYRFLRVALFAFVTSLPVTIDTNTLSWGVLASLGAGALETAFRQYKPSFPLDKTNGVVVQAVKEQATQLATAAINAAVEDHQHGVAMQAGITSFLAAQAQRTGEAAAQAALAQTGGPAAVPDATPPAAAS